MSMTSQSGGERSAAAARTSAIPHGRAWKIGTRTLHLVVTYLLFGGHLLGAPAARLEWLLWMAVASGVGLIFLEAYPSWQTTVQGWGLLVAIKLALLAAVPFAWNFRLPLLLAVVAIGGIGSHLPARYRHYSFLYGRVIKPV